MRETFIEKRFSAAHMEIIEAANEILRKYMAAGFTLTLRQLYYQFVATQPLRTEFKNTQQSYKKLGYVISDARLAGLIDWNAMEDRTRSPHIPPAWSSPRSIVGACVRSYQIDLWQGQPVYMEAWIEKDALVGVLEAACEPFRLPFFSCRGYTSQSSLYEAGHRLRRRGGGRRIVVLHLGDHDPSGIDMTRDIHERLAMFSGRTDMEVRRIALNMDQIDELNPPPNPAKLSDSRAGDYVARFGRESWELDALDPDYIARIIRREVMIERDEATWQTMVKREAEEKAEIRLVHDHWQVAVEAAEDAEGSRGEEE